jgi:hypothetical protein
MGNSSSSFIPRLTTHIHTSNGAVFRQSYLDLVDHILLLRQVIAHPEMTEKGDKLDYIIQDYCHRMSNNQLMSKYQQSNLPCQIEWIWHVHRLHPVAYLNDCTKQIPGNYFIDKKIQKVTINEYQTQNYAISKELVRNQATFVPSLNLEKAVLQQRDFLEKFQKHRFYSMNLRFMDLISFEQIVQNYISFMKLARKNTIIVPTFDIDLIWHTHMRSPFSYLEFSTALCGFLLDHDDSIPSQILIDSYRDTADRWKTTYHTDYGQNIDRNRLRTAHYLSSCAIVHKTDAKKSLDHGGSGGCGGYWYSTDGDASSCGSSCGGGCGGD